MQFIISRLTKITSFFDKKIRFKLIQIISTIKIFIFPNKIIVFNTILILSILFFSGCKGCSPSGRRTIKEGRAVTNNVEVSSTSIRGKSQIIKMREENGVYYVPVIVNGVPMEFVFDTGASMISMSAAEALFLLKQGKLKEEDFLGSQEFVDALGNISEGTRVNLKTIQIGNKVLKNVTASIVHNLEAPLLLGQTALRPLGEIKINYQRNELIFK